MKDSQTDFNSEYNKLYQNLRDRSADIKNSMASIYKLRQNFSKAFLINQFNLGKLFTSTKDDALSTVLKRTPLRYGSFLDFYHFIRVHLKRCKAHRVIERLKTCRDIDA